MNNLDVVRQGIVDGSLTKLMAIKGILVEEAGYVNDPSDSGGETNLGITKATAATYQKDLTSMYNWDGQMVNLTSEMAIYIYGKEYWDKLLLDRILPTHAGLAFRIFDIGVNCGIGKAGLWLKQSLNLLTEANLDVSGGFVGEKTLAAISGLVAKYGNEAGVALYKMMYCKQGNHYMESAETYPKNRKWIRGWINRLP